MSFTQGPWRAVPNTGRIHAEVGGSTVQVATVGDYRDSEILPYNKERWNADAALIAAAPDLLSALKEIAKGEGRYSRDPLEHAANAIEDMKAIALAAIARAEGRS